MEYDVFLSHASEDKAEVGAPLARKLRSWGVNVWYDDFILQIGDSLSEKIDYGLANSRKGVVVLSHNFFEKKWTKRELRGLIAREIDDQQLILPVWHNIT